VNLPANRFCLPLELADNLTLSGAKAFNLARISSLGLAVPDSFVITTAALDYFLTHAGLQERVALILTEQTDESSDRQNEVYEHLCRDVMAADIPDKLRVATNPLIKPLLSSAVNGLAVRSSASCEDSDQASFAGIFETAMPRCGAKRYRTAWNY